jgi:hypothetical protein
LRYKEGGGPVRNIRNVYSVVALRAGPQVRIDSITWIVVMEHVRVGSGLLPLSFVVTSIRCRTIGKPLASLSRPCIAGIKLGKSVKKTT